MIIELLCLSVVLLCIVVVGRYHGVFNLIDPVSFFALTNVVLGFVGILYRERYEYSAYISDEASLILIKGMVFFCAGVFFANKFNANDSVRARRSLASGHITNTSLYYIVWGGGALFSLLYIFATGGVSWGDVNFEDTRVINRQGFGWLALSSTAFVMVPTLALLIVNRANGKSLIAYMAMVFLSFLILLLPGNRGPAMDLLVAAGFFYCFFRWRRVPVVPVLVGAFFIFIILSFLGVVRSGDLGDLEIALLKSIWRPYVNLFNFENIYTYFPDYVPFQHGFGYVIDFLVVLPGYQPNFGLWVKDALNFDFAGGSITLGFAGELYANFGEYGVYVGYFLFAVFLVFLSRLMSRWQGDKFLVGRYVISMSVKAMAVSGIVSPVLYFFIPMFFVVFFLGFIDKK